MSKKRFHAPFDIDLPRAVKEQLIEAFATLAPARLDDKHLSQVPPQRGVYQLYDGSLQVCVGKAGNLRNRLRDHYRKVSGRKNIDLKSLNFTCLSINKNWTALAPEAQLIEHYKQNGGSIWNGRGFGPHDAGRGREERNDPPAWFDGKYPIREDWPCSTIEPGEWNINELLNRVKLDLPFLLRFERHKKKPHPDFTERSVVVPKSNMRIDGLLRLVAENLPTGWQVTQFHSHVILYKELKKYKYGTTIWPTGDNPSQIPT